MPSRIGRHAEGRPRRRLTSPTTWIAVLAAAVLSAAIALGMAPAQASATVEVQLTLSGLASPDNPTGGSKVGVHPGDTVVMHASAIPTAGAPGGLSSALSGLVAGVAGLQVKILSGNLPGVHYPFALGKIAHCGGAASLPLRSLAKGTYTFNYVVQKISLATSVLGVTACHKSTVTPTHDQLGALTQHNVKVTDNAVYGGSIVVAVHPPGGQIGIQLPKQSISAKVGPIHTSVNLPGATVGVPNPVPSITKAIGGKVPGVGGKNGGGGKNSGKGGSGNVDYAPPGVTVPEEVMPHAVNVGGAGGSGYAAPGSNTGNQGSGIGGHIVAPPAHVTSTAVPVAHPSDVANAGSRKTVDLGAKDTGAAQLPVVLAVLAILALSLVTAGYARKLLLRRT
jgi:hypothetical protein